MAWLAVLTLPNGDRVETSMSTSATVTANPGESWYRLHRADGSIREFSTLASILIHLGDYYDPDDLDWATRR